VSEVPPEDDPGWQHRFADLGSVRLHYVEAGPPGTNATGTNTTGTNTAPLVVLLHGFPEFWYAWRRQILPLAAAGFRVVALDLRGYNLSDKPRGIASYGMRVVVDDVLELIRQLGAPRASLVGHDFGAGVAWAFAMRHPDALERLIVLNGPHPVRMARGLCNPRQLLRSWYMFLFQLPWLPEYLARRNDHALLFAPFAALPSAAQLTPEERQAYRSALEQPGALTAMINYYRAMFRPSGAVRLRRIDAPVLVLWGDQDAYLGRALAPPGARWASRAQLEYFPGVGHFIQHEAPERVTERLIEFLLQS
jgi:epoxide hydrolase 4